MMSRFIAPFETERLALRRFTLIDAAFILDLVNSPGWVRYIGDRGVRTLEDAQRYLRDGPLTSYERHRFGLCRVARKFDDIPVGICGLLKRDTLPDIELGFAFLPEHAGQGYASEAAAAVISRAADELGCTRLTAVAQADNAASLRVLAKLGFVFDRVIRIGDDTTELHFLVRDGRR